MNNQLNAFLQKRWTVPAATAVAGFGVGTFVGYMFTRRQYDRIEAELARVDAETDEIIEVTESMKEAAFSAEVEKRVALELEKRMPHILGAQGLGYDTPSELDEESLAVLREDHPSSFSKRREEGTVSPIRRDLEPETIIGHTTDVRTTTDGHIEFEGVTHMDPRRGKVVNVFGDGAGDEWDYKTEIESRDRSRPYIIHIDEFNGDEMGWDSQSTLTWYEKDKILTDSHDKPIHNPNEIVGLPLEFGHGSNDPNVVYIRNEKLEAEYEVLRDSGSYEEVVLGEAMEAAAEAEGLRHSHNMRFRSD